MLYCVQKHDTMLAEITERVEWLEKLIIQGGKRLMGEVSVNGAKNAAVAIIPACILINGVSRIENLPCIEDVSVSLEIAKSLGARITYLSCDVVEIDSRDVRCVVPPQELAGRIRASYYYIGVLLAKFQHATVPLPGGCNFGFRPMDQHIKAFEALGAECTIKKGMIHAASNGPLRGGNIYFDCVTVGATINAVLASVLSDGETTIIENAAKEPHVVDLANFLNSRGANIKGAGTDKIRITGVKELVGGTYSVIPDQIEAGTLMAAAAATHGDVMIKNVIPQHLDSISAKLIEIGAGIEEFDDSIRVYSKGQHNSANIKTLPYPGFPTDMQPQLVAMLSVAEGTSVITEGVWDNRFQYVDELRKLGADITVDGNVAVIRGKRALSGANVMATDLRGGVGMVIAGLIAEGTTTVGHILNIDRGYEFIERKLSELGADIKRVDI